jgi:cystathionine gamma-lyase
MESLTNPLLKVIDIQTISKEAKAINPDIKIVVDNTFCSPLITSPLLLGADVSLNSVSKFIGGHSDIIMGVLVFKDREYRKKVHFAAYTVGVNSSPFDCYLALRGIKTLELRIRQATKNAYHIAHFLEEQNSVEEVCYPGLKSNKYHELALKQMRGFGGVVTFAIKGGKEQVSKFLKACKLIIMATSLGGTETLASSPKFMNVTACP